MRPLMPLFALALTACASVPPAEVDARMNAWEGVHINTLMDSWGPPSNQYEAAGVKYFSWSNEQRGTGASSPSIGVGVGSFGGNVGVNLGTVFGGGPKNAICTRSAELAADGTVKRIRWNGEPEYCRDVTPVRK